MGADPDTLMKLIKPMYGQVDAPRRWFLRAVNDLKSIGLRQHPLDPCILLSFNDSGECDGFINLYVDDFSGAGDINSATWNTRVQKVKEMFKFRKWVDHDHMEHCGVDSHQSDGHRIDLNMITYLKKLKPVTINQNLNGEERELDIKEKRQLRGLLGALQWPASQAGPHLQASVSIHQGQLPKATVACAKEVNRTLRYAKSNSDVGVTIQKVSEIDDMMFMGST